MNIIFVMVKKMLRSTMILARWSCKKSDLNITKNYRGGNSKKDNIPRTNHYEVEF